MKTKIQSKIGNRKSKIRIGFTLVEMMIAMVISMIVILAVAVSLVDSQKAWGNMYGDINSNVSVQSLTACKRFDAVIRQASSNNYSIDPAGNWVEVDYYSSSSATSVDRYARFTWQNHQLTYEYGSLGPKTTLGTQTLCSNVTDCRFQSIGRSVRMFLTLNDNTRSITVTSSDVMNNN